MKIIQIPLLVSQYNPTAFTKKQIVLHGTNSALSSQQISSSWQTNPFKFGVHFIIDRDGSIYQFCESHYWMHHIGFNVNNFITLDQKSIAISLCCVGPVKKVDDHFYTLSNSVLDKSEVIQYAQEFRGHCYFQRYSDAQLQNLKKLLQKLCNAHKIPTHVSTEKWDISQAALDGKPGIYTSIHYRPDRSDCHPQKELIEILLSL